jgi:hypothetical protein
LHLKGATFPCSPLSYRAVKKKGSNPIKVEAEFPNLDIISFLKFIYTTTGIDKFLLAGKEGVALIADIHF